MTQQPSGWYDDPKDPAQLRYWDGVIWTDHVAPKKSPTVDQSWIGGAHPVQPAAEPRPQQPQQPWQYPQDSRSPGKWSGQRSGQGHPAQYGRADTTPDGAVLSGWWRRVLARIIDAIIVTIIGLPFTGWFYAKAGDLLSTWVNQFMTDVRNGVATTAPVPTEVYSYLVPAQLIGVLVYFVYEVLFVRHRGATPGKMALGISIRLRDRPGAPPVAVILKRFGVFKVGDVIGVIPVLGFLGSMFSLLDRLWPLWDDRNQALHDKVTATNVVMGRQPPPQRDH